MSWIEKLYETYENCIIELGNTKYSTPFAPVAHSDRPVHIEVFIDEKGYFTHANWVDSENTIIPITEKSAGRTAGCEPHPLADQLQYVAGDYKDFGGNKKPYFREYHALLSNWCKSVYSNYKVSLVLKYIEKKCLITDLVNDGKLFIDHNNKLLKTWNGDNKDKPQIFSLLSASKWQADSFIRWCVEIPELEETRLWLDKDVWLSWQKYYRSTRLKKGLCYISGDSESLLATSHLKRVRSNADNGKFISSNDTSGFTYRGRFLNGEQACTIGYEVSQKAHNALRWLIAKQGYRDGELAIVAWAPKGIEIPDPFEDSYNICAPVEDKYTIVDTAEITGITLAKRIAGYSEKLGPTDDIVVLGISSATPGRLSVSFYRELAGADFLSRVEHWHTKCAWLQNYSKDKIFYGAPAPKDIAWAAFGTKLGTTGRVEVDDKIKRQTIERLLPCIIDGLNIPSDIVRSLVRSASKRIIYSNWEWEKTLGIACAIYKYSKKEKNYVMALEKERTSRDYLFGRLLAVADCWEGFALSQTEKGRSTNAARMMQRFAEHPCSTWRNIELALTPYKARLGNKGSKYEKALEEIMNNFIADDFSKDTALSGEFLLGFHTQRSVLMKKIDNETKGEKE